VTSTVVIQSKQGIGDVIWHLSYVRAIAAALRHAPHLGRPRVGADRALSCCGHGACQGRRWTLKAAQAANIEF
jgi:hypothetical protein